jgi:DNA-binding beta-propeller fold protein YncE
MHLIPMTPPAHVQTLSGFDYVTTDAARRRIFAAHTGSNALLIANADGGAILGQVRVGPLHGVAVDPANGHVYTGDGLQRTVSEVDPVAMTVVGTAAVDGTVDAIAYDPTLHRVYADEDDGTRIFVVDTLTMKETGTVQLPGHKPEYLAIDAKTHELYQNIDDLGEIVVVDPQSLKVVRTISTPVIQHNHPLIYDSADGVLLVGGKNSVMASYSTDGKLLGTATVPAGIDQCAFDPGTHDLVCAGSAKAAVIQVSANGALTPVGDEAVAKGVHTMSFDEKTGHLWIVWADTTGDYLQGLTLTP